MTLMTALRIGCATQPVDRSLHLDSFALVEIDESFHAPMRARTLRRWRAEMAKEAEAVLPLWRALVADPLDERSPPEEVAGLPRDAWGLLRPTDTNRALWETFRQGIEAVAADLLLLRTPVGFSPADANRANLATFLREQVAPTGLQTVWEPSGLWEAEDAATFAAELGVLLAINPFLESDFPEITAASGYYVLTGPAPGRSRFTEDDLIDFLDFVAEHEAPVRAVFRGAERVWAARRLHKLASAQED